MDSFPGEFIARKFSMGDEYLAFTMVAKENNSDQTRVRNRKGYFIAQVIIDPNDPYDQSIVNSTDPVEEIKKFIDTMGTEFNQQNKMDYEKVIDLKDGRRIGVPINRNIY